MLLSSVSFHPLITAVTVSPCTCWYLHTQFSVHSSNTTLKYHLNSQRVLVEASTSGFSRLWFMMSDHHHHADLEMNLKLMWRLLTLWPCSTTQTHRPRLPLCTTISETEIRRPNDLYLFYMFLGDQVFLPALNFPSCLPFTWPCAAWLHRLCSRDTYRIRTHLRARQTHTLTHKSQKNKQEKTTNPKQ